MLSSVEAAKNEQAIRDLLGESARDGHEISNLEWLLQRRLEEVTPSSRRPPPDDAAKAAAITKLNEKIPDKQLAQNNMAGRNVIIQQLQAHVREEQDADVRFVALERARKQTVKKADLVLCRQFLERLGAEFEIDLEKLWLESLEEMTDYVQSPQQAEVVCEAMVAAYGFGWPSFEAGSASEQKLSSAEELARKYELKMTLDRIHYLTGQK
jgi:tellurite resistance protein